MNVLSSDASETVVPFARDAAPPIDDPLDSAGRSILGLLQRAASMAEETSQHALGVAHKLSVQLRSAEDRIRDLEADVRHYQERADRAEKWLLKISLEIEERFFSSTDKRAPQASVRQPGPQDYARKR
jgi:hypothetical protein